MTITRDTVYFISSKGSSELGVWVNARAVWGLGSVHLFSLTRWTGWAWGWAHNLLWDPAPCQGQGMLCLSIFSEIMLELQFPRAQALLRLLTSCVRRGENRKQEWLLEKEKALFSHIAFEMVAWISIQLSFKSELKIKPGFFFFCCYFCHLHDLRST